MKIKLVKLEELPDAKHPNNIQVGFEVVGHLIREPEVGAGFFVGYNWRTSPIVEILDNNVFRTYNSIYQYTEID